MGRYFGPSGTEEFQYPPIMRLIGTKVTQGWECSEVDNVKMRTNLMRVCMCVCVRARVWIVFSVRVLRLKNYYIIEIS